MEQRAKLTSSGMSHQDAYSSTLYLALVKFKLKGCHQNSCTKGPKWQINSAVIWEA
jgi:hypothetical protein